MIIINKIEKHNKSICEYYARNAAGINFRFITMGALNSNRDNCVLLQHPLSYDFNSLTLHRNNTGWWDDIVKDGGVICQKKNFIIIASSQSIVKSCLKQNISVNFKLISNIQENIIKYFNILKIFLVVGGSLGGAQALDFVCCSRLQIDNLIVISFPHKAYPNQFFYRLIIKKLIQIKNEYKINELSKIIRLISHIVYRDPDAFNSGLKDDVCFVEKYLSHCKIKIPKINMNIYNIFLKMMNEFNREIDLESINSRILILGSSSDIFYTQKQLKEFNDLLVSKNKNVKLKIVQSSKGHDAFLIEQKKFSNEMNEFLSLRNVY